MDEPGVRSGWRGEGGDVHEPPLWSGLICSVLTWAFRVAVSSERVALSWEGIPVKVGLFLVQVGMEWEWILGKINAPGGLRYAWLVSDVGRAVGPWLFGVRYWSNSCASNPSNVPMTSVLRSEMSTLLKSMFWRPFGRIQPPSEGRWTSCLVPMWTSVFGVLGGVGGPWDWPGNQKYRNQLISKNNNELPLKETVSCNPTGPVLMVIAEYFSSRWQLHCRFCFTQTILLLCWSGSAVPFTRFGHLTPPRLVFIIRIGFLVLHPESISLFNEGALLCFSEKSGKKERDEPVIDVENVH